MFEEREKSRTVIDTILKDVSNTVIVLNSSISDILKATVPGGNFFLRDIFSGNPDNINDRRTQGDCQGFFR